MDVNVSLAVRADPGKTACRLKCGDREAIVIFRNDEHRTVEFETATEDEAASGVAS